MVVPREPVSLSGHFPDCIQAADSDVFNCDIYKCQQPVNGERHDWSCFVVCQGFCDNRDGM